MAPRRREMRSRVGSIDDMCSSHYDLLCDEKRLERKRCLVGVKVERGVKEGLVWSENGERKE
jgi:hypothetical protein